MKLNFPMAVLVAIVPLTIAPLASVSAQTADFRCPVPGTEFTFKSGSTSSTSTVTGQDGNVCLVTSVSDGRTAQVRLHWGLLGSVEAAGESYARGIDLKSLWPLKVGNKTEQTVTAIGHDGKSYTTKVTMTVAAYEKVTVPAGTFDAFRVEESKGAGSKPHIHWWAPSLAFSVKESFPDWTDLTKLKVHELTAVKPAGR